MEIARIGIVGAGIMGSGIAGVFARQGFTTIVCDVDSKALADGKTQIEKSLARGRQTGKLSEADAKRILGQLRFCTSLDELSRSDLIIEAIVERLDIKLDVFARLDELTPDHTILASNTSSLPLIELAKATHRPDRVVGMHFFNPAPVMKLLELVRSIATSDETLATVRQLGEKLGKTVIVAQDRAGFIVNLLLIPYIANAIRLFESGFASREDIDTGMKLGCSHPMGPLELVDYVGLDTTLFVCETLHAEYGNPEYAPPTLLRRMVAAGYLGRKSGRGFYEYPPR